jgi:exodeoxyribonuclease V alpha subunit
VSTDAPAAEKVELEGRVMRVFSASPKWSAGKLLVNYREVSYTANGPTSPNTVITLRGKWVEHEKFGRQFEGEIVPAMPATTDGLREWLARTAAGVGPHRAHKLVSEYGTAVLNVCAGDPEAAAKTAGVSVKAIRALVEAWERDRAQVAAFAALVEMGLSPGQAEKVYAVYKGAAPQAVRDDPYCLMREVDGFGWKTADELARKLGVAADSPKRRKAAVVQAVLEAYGDGSTATDEAAAIGKACDLCESPFGTQAAFEPLVGECVAAGHLCRVPTGTAGGSALALPAPYVWELSLWNVLATSRDRNPHVPRDDADATADLYTHVGDKELDDTQRAALRLVASHRLTFITGGAGSGKTTLARAIHRMFTDLRVDVYLCAPTGQSIAALKDVIGADASTIHRLLGYNPASTARSRASPTTRRINFPAAWSSSSMRRASMVIGISRTTCSPPVGRTPRS